MANVIDYGLIESDSQAELAEAVNEAIREGWQPQGGLVIWREAGGRVGTSTPLNVHYAQALVKYSQ